MELERHLLASCTLAIIIFGCFGNILSALVFLQVLYFKYLGTPFLPSPRLFFLFRVYIMSVKDSGRLTTELVRSLSILKNLNF